jgi:hypothetical protein
MYFCLGIQLVDRESNQFHSVALYRSNGSLMIGDLQSHFTTRRKPALFCKSLFWICPDLCKEEQQILAAKIDAWLEENENKIPYSVADSGGIKFKDNLWIGNQPGIGLTCATFIVELFNELAIPFIDASTWQKRDGDTIWATKILDLLSNEMDPEHVHVQQNRIGESIRIRPSDVTAAGYLLDQNMEVALSFEKVSPISSEIELNLINTSF